jgi:hypothetical protein
MQVSSKQSIALHAKSNYNTFCRKLKKNCDLWLGIDVLDIISKEQCTKGKYINWASSKLGPSARCSGIYL